MENFYTTEEINEKVKKINYLNNEYYQWVLKKAQKQHKDLFGKIINVGEYYFRLHVGYHYSNDLKMSYDSMDKFLYAVFYPSPELEKYAFKVMVDKENKVRKLIEKLREQGKVCQGLPRS